MIFLAPSSLVAHMRLDPEIQQKPQWRKQRNEGTHPSTKTLRLGFVYLFVWISKSWASQKDIRVH